ncbi:MAG: hypothetical protein HY744_17365 [Deltaproteobacteria bacterium]|nr:hypothetical protein [Deltaproteobacteria bacterium]
MRGRHALLVAPALAGTLLAFAFLASCTDDRPSSSVATCPSCPCPTRVVDAALLAFLSKARRAHHEADLLEKADRPEQAIQVLDHLAATPAPGGASPPPEVREVLADTRARLAELRSARGDFEAAGRDVEAGLELAVDVTHFRGRLVEMRGVIEERRAKALQERGELQAAASARERAIAAFEQAVGIQEEVIGRALGDGGVRQ